MSFTNRGLDTNLKSEEEDFLMLIQLLKKCCIGGKAFFDALKAMITRLLFILHSLIAIWRVTITTGQLYWLMCIVFSLLIVETGIVLFIRRGHEWKWFTPCLLFYLAAVVPPIWILELDKLRFHQAKLNSTVFAFDINKVILNFFFV